MDHSGVGYAVGPQPYGRQGVEGGDRDSQGVHPSLYATGGDCAILYSAFSQ